MVLRRSASSDCSNSSYTTPEGLQFSVYCGKDQTGIGDVNNAGADTVEDCLNQCSTHAGSACGAAAFDSNLRKCYFKSANITANGAVDRAGFTLGVANRTQYQPITASCDNNGQTQKADNGLGFTVYCDQTVAGSDVCPDSAPDCRSHADSLQECLDSCATMHPLCTGIAWDTTMFYGYVNCYPKNAAAQQFDDARTPLNGLNCAKALLETHDDDCLSRANGTVIASNKDTFELTCNQDNGGGNITAQHADSLDSCIDSCATYTKADCLGAVFDVTMANGYENCYLKSAIGGSETNRNSVTFALRQTTPTNSNHKTSKAWIAGPVIGAIAAILIIAGLWWWWRRRKQRRGHGWQGVQTHNPDEAKTWQGQELAPTTAQKHELESQPKVYEMDSTHDGNYSRDVSAWDARSEGRDDRPTMGPSSQY